MATNSTPPPPAVSKALVEYLERIHPDRCPDPETPEREVWMAAGAASVIRKLRTIHNSQIKDSLVGK